MSKQAYLHNQEIARFVLDKAASGEPYTQEQLAYVNQYVGFGGMWNYDEALIKAGNV